MRAAFAVIAVLALVGCSTRVRVINDETREPVAGAKVVPWVNNMWGTPWEEKARYTDAKGEVNLPYPKSKIHGVRVSAGEMEEVHPQDREYEEAGVMLTYVRQPVTVKLKVVEGFRGILAVRVDNGWAVESPQREYEFEVKEPLNVVARIPLRQTNQRWAAVIGSRQVGLRSLRDEEGEFWLVDGGFYDFGYATIYFVGARADALVLSKRLKQWNGPFRMTREKLSLLGPSQK